MNINGLARQTLINACGALESNLERHWRLLRNIEKRIDINSGSCKYNI
jgi:hypothetical protein